MNEKLLRRGLWLLPTWKVDLIATWWRVQPFNSYYEKAAHVYTDWKRLEPLM